MVSDLDSHHWLTLSLALLSTDLLQLELVCSLGEHVEPSINCTHNPSTYPRCKQVTLWQKSYTSGSNRYSSRSLHDELNFGSDIDSIERRACRPNRPCTPAAGRLDTPAARHRSTSIDFYCTSSRHCVLPRLLILYRLRRVHALVRFFQYSPTGRHRSSNEMTDLEQLTCWVA